MDGFGHPAAPGEDGGNGGRHGCSGYVSEVDATSGVTSTVSYLIDIDGTAKMLDGDRRRRDNEARCSQGGNCLRGCPEKASGSDVMEIHLSW